MNYDEAVFAAKDYGVEIIRINDLGKSPVLYQIFGSITEWHETTEGSKPFTEFFYFGTDINLEFLKQQFATFLTNAMAQDSKELIMTSIFKLAGDVFKYLSAEMMDQDKPVVMTIKAINTEEIANQQGKSEKGVIYFKETKRGMVLGNKTNLRNLIEATGTTEVEEMIGKKIKLRVEPFTAFGKSGMTIRIDPKPVRTAKDTAKVAHVDEQQSDVPQNEERPMPLFDDIAQAGAYSE